MRAVAPQMIANGGTVSQGKGMLNVSCADSVSIRPKWDRVQALKQKGPKLD